MSRIILLLIVLAVMGGMIYVFFFASSEKREQILTTAQDAAGRVRAGAEDLGNQVGQQVDEARPPVPATEEEKLMERRRQDATFRQVHYADPSAPLGPVLEKIMEAAYARDERMVQTKVKDLILPDAAVWFEKVFGAETGKKLAAVYVPLGEKALPPLRQGLGQAAAAKQDKAMVTRYVPAAEGAGAEQKIFDAMKDPLPLYSAVMVRGGSQSGTRLAYFVYVEGVWRYVGSLDAAGR